MPTYVFRCSNPRCQALVEVLTTVECASMPQVCGNCGDFARRVFAPVAVGRVAGAGDSPARN